MRTCAPGRGTTVAYDLIAAANRNAAAMASRQAAEARMLELWRQAANDAQRLQAAEKAYTQGDIRLASRIYTRLALSRPKREGSEKAKQRLGDLAAEATRQLQEIDKTLEDEEAIVSPGELFDPSVADKPAVRQWHERVQSAFDRYEELAEDYEGVPDAARELRSHLRKQRMKPEYAVVLHEPRAKALWEVGQKHEADDQACCAYWAYREASQLIPAPSAKLAEKRLAAMQQDPQVLAAAEACRNLQECHRLYERAQRIEQARPSLARDLYAQVAARAPEDTELCQAARRRLEELEE